MQVEVLRRRVWLIATVAALFGLQAPLCALACLDNPFDLLPVASESGDHPCHQESPDPEPASGDSHGDCCQLAYQAIFPGSVDTASAGLSLAEAPPSTVRLLGQADCHLASVVPEFTDLPPPDILLLKSTLLI